MEGKRESEEGGLRSVRELRENERREVHSRNGGERDRERRVT